MIQEHHKNKEFRWADGTTLLVTLTFDFQGGEHVKPDRSGILNLEDYAIGEYGPNTGVWRIMDMLDEEGVKATFLTCGAIAERYPEAAQEIVARGHEIAGHGYHHETARLLPKDEERDVMRRTHDMIKATTGRDIAGWRSCTQSLNTIDLLIDRGALWNSNSFSHDMPYLWERDGKYLVELPRHTFGDGRGYGKSECNNPLNLITIWEEAFDELYEEAQKGRARYLPFQIHPYISGRPGRTKALRTTIRHMKQAGVSFATCSDTANWVLRDLFQIQSAAPRREMAFA
jgi:peptidoglycan/xylan/chitin deacetylase (PgdA/CDA1 family)